ncbi:MAG: flagellar biosynthesis protein FlhF, partial [Pirellulales bacterium]
MQEALSQVRRELGSQASVLHTREVRPSGLMRFLGGSRMIEVVASASVSVPSRLKRPKSNAASAAVPPAQVPFALPEAHAASDSATRAASSGQLVSQLSELQSRVEDLFRRAPQTTRADVPDDLFHLFTDLIDADISEDLARELVERVRRQPLGADPLVAQSPQDRLTALIEAEIPIAGPIQVTPGRRHLVALVGPTGVGKTTTIAKLAANFRLREKRRVGLITVDTYRIAAVEQLRTYADIIDLPMEIVATPREMHQAVARMADQDLILMDTAGRSPRDEVKIQELKSMLAEASPDEVHLVLASVGGASNLAKTAEQFAPVGTTALLLTKLDEAASLGNVLTLLRSSRLGLSYLTHGQNVPDDIAAADKRAAKIEKQFAKG